MKVSYIIPAFNKEAYIAEAIHSVLVQTHKDNEIIIVDDCSTDGTSDIVEYFANQNKNIKYIKNKKNIGVANCRNLGRSKASGDIICVLDADDYSYPKRSEIMVGLFKQYKKVDIFYGNAIIIDVRGVKVGEKYCADFNLSKIKKVQDNIVHSTVAYRNTVKTQYRHNARFIDDWYFYLDAYNDGYTLNPAEYFLSAWRVEPVGLTYSGGMKTKEKQKAKEKLINEFKDFDVDLTPAMDNPTQKTRMKKLLQEIPSGSKVLDVGCNGGYFLEKVKQKSCKALGIDIAPNLIKICKKKKLNAQIMKAENIDKLNGKFDRIILGDILEHYNKTDLYKILWASYDKLTKTGKLVITLPYKHNIYSKKFDSSHIEDYTPKDIGDAWCHYIKMDYKPIYHGNDAIPLWYLITVAK